MSASNAPYSSGHMSSDSVAWESTLTGTPPTVVVSVPSVTCPACPFARV